MKNIVGFTTSVNINKRIVVLQKSTFVNPGKKFSAGLPMPQKCRVALVLIAEG